MKQNVNLKSTLRQPVRTLLLLLLVGLISFAFIARAVEYLVVRQETERLGGYYRAIGSLVPDDPEARAMPDEAAALLANSKYIDFEDSRREASGVMEGTLNTDLSGMTSDHSMDMAWTKRQWGSATYIHMASQTAGAHVSDMLVYGVLTSIAEGEIDNSCMLVFAVDGVEAGYPEIVSEGTTIRVTYLPENIDMPPLEAARLGEHRAPDADAFISGLTVGERYLIKAYYNVGLYGVYHEFPLNGIQRRLFMLPLTDAGLWYLPVSEGRADLEDPALADLKDDLAVLHANQSTMQVISTKDMSAMPVTQESARRFYLTDGRWLNREDDLNGNRVCVVNSVFAELRGLTVGDTIHLTLRDMRSDMLGYITDGMGDTWRTLPTHAEELEIVGLYSDLSVDYHPTSHRTPDYTLYLYIPDSVMPAAFGAGVPARTNAHQIPLVRMEFERFNSDDPADWTNEGLPDPESAIGFWENETFQAATYSFVLKSARDEAAFLAENQAALAQLGLSVAFAPNNAVTFWTSAESLLRSTALNAVVYALLLLLALALAVFLYLGQRRREFVIQRTLGVPARRAVVQMLFPLTLLGFVGVFAGGLFSWRYALGKAASTLSAVVMEDGGAVEATLSPLWPVGIAIGTFAALLLMAGLGAGWIARRPVLALLQGTARRARGLAEDALSPAGAPRTEGEPGMVMGDWAAWQLPPGTKMPLFAPQARFIRRQILRTPLKSLLVIAVALAYTISTGWMTRTVEFSKDEIDRLYDSVVVEAEIVQSDSTGRVTGEGFIGRHTVDALLDSGLVQSVYLEAITDWEMITPPIAHGRNFDDVWKELPRIESLRVVGINNQDAFLAATGTGAEIEFAEGYDAGVFAADWGNYDDIVPVVLPDDYIQRLGLELGGVVLKGRIAGAAVSTACVIVGKVTGSSDILIPMSTMARMEQGDLRYTEAKFVFDPSQNRALMESRAALQAIVDAPGAGNVALRLLLWDEELREVIGPMEKNLNLLSVLYPVTLAVSSLISAGLALLLVLQSARDAAILRVLGTSKRKTRATLLVQQGALCLLGLLLGGVGTWLLFHVLDFPAAALYLAACLLAALSAAYLVTRKKPLDLLQVKE